jgi:exonuclease SbcC
MRPLTLRFAAFGTFPGEHEIDFGRLQELGLFVVTGPTGAGKTTIFDAMGYALYGKLPGDRPEGEVRSDYVADTVACSVALEFDAAGGRFRVSRSPAYRRPKRRGEGFTDAPAKVSLEKWTPDGWEGMSSKASEVDSLCAGAVGLSSDQFERVILLPQGKFQQFLVADTKDRRPLLQTLFGTRVYEEAVAEMRVRANAAGAAVDEAESEIRRLVANAVDELGRLVEGLQSFEGGECTVEIDETDIAPEYVREQVAALGPRIDALAAARDAADRGAAGAAARAATAEATAKQWDTHQGLVQRLSELEERRDSVESDRGRLERSRRFAPLAVAISDQVARERARDEAEAKRDRVLDELVRVLADLSVDLPTGVDDILVVVPTALDGERGRQVEVAESLAGLEQARTLVEATGQAALAAQQHNLEAVERVDELATALDAARERTAQLRSSAAAAPELDEAVRALEVKVRLRRRLERARDDLVGARSALVEAQQAHLEAWDGFIAGNAPRLARELSDDEPCPVCGSRDHPAPARAVDGVHVDYEDVERAKNEQEASALRVQSLETESTSFQEQLGDDAAVEPVALDDRLDAAVEQRADALAAVTELEALTTRIAADQDERNRLFEDMPRLARDVGEAETARREAEGSLSALIIKVGEIDADELVRRGHALDAADRAIQQLVEALSALSGSEGALRNAREFVERLVDELDVSDVDEALVAVLTPEVDASLAGLVRGSDEELARTNGGLEAFSDVELPMDRPDVDQIRARAADLRAEADRLAKSVNELGTRRTSIEDDVAGAIAARSSNEAAVERHRLLDSVASLCEGKGQARISLETWVLAGELDRVLIAANVHLQRMTGGRFRLERTDDAGHGGRQAGLDIAVFDVFTGKTRPPKSLSGGEQFQTSLALALGLADVVSHGGIASGHRFEALFVDEGFGSLDPAALGQAMDALHDIRAAGRMVGVITHVAAMKDELPTGISVERLPDGQGSTLIVRPGG